MVFKQLSLVQFWISDTVSWVFFMFFFKIGNCPSSLRTCGLLASCFFPRCDPWLLQVERFHIRGETENG